MILSSREYDIQFKTSLYNLNHSWSEKEIDSVKVKKICLLQSKYTYSVDINFKVKKKKKGLKKRLKNGKTRILAILQSNLKNIFKLVVLETT